VIDFPGLSEHQEVLSVNHLNLLDQIGVTESFEDGDLTYACAGKSFIHVIESADF
jgi:hypothetical protein